MNIYISTGEISGEQHAARLVRACEELGAEIEWTGMGSRILEEAGVRIKVNADDLRVMGIFEVITHLPAIRRAFKETMAHIEHSRPDAVVLVDYPGYNLRLAEKIKKKFPHMPVIYYIAPKVWAWNTRRVHRIRKAVDLILSILPFEETWFAGCEIRATYVGNPVADAVRGVSGKELRGDMQLSDNDKLVAIFPGSRKREVGVILPDMLKAVELLRKKLPATKFALAAAEGMSDEILSELNIPSDIKIIRERNFELMAAADFVFAKSGTTTLECALIETPMVIAYKFGTLSAIVAKLMVKLKWFSLPNIMAGKEIAKEFFQWDITPKKLADEAELLLTDENARMNMIREFQALKRQLGNEPAPRRAADALITFLDNTLG